MFNTPTSGWTGTDVACDVSRYKDYPGTAPDVKYEPTLSLRYLFKVRPATDIADNIKKALMSGTAYEDNGHITLGMYNGYKGNITLRMAISDLSMYYFYPYTNTDFAAPSLESHFGTTLCQGKTVTWTAITRIGTKYYYHILKDAEGTETMLQGRYDININIESFKGEYRPVSDGLGQPSSDVHTISSMAIGQPYYVLAYVNDYDSHTATTKHSTPVARYTYYFRAESAPQDIDSLDYNRTHAVLERNYTQVADISFDDMAGMNYNKPDKIYVNSDAYNNQWNQPLDWNRTYYGFVYPGLTSQMNLNSDWMRKRYKYSPYHGDYVIIKSMNDPVASKTAIENYWFYAPETLYDATYYRTGGKQYGYFVYLDATDEARPIISTDFDANLCEGSTVIAAINIANMTDKASAPPQLMFKIYGEAIDQQTGKKQSQLIQSFASGDFKSVGATETGRWYQVFAYSVIATGTHPEKYSHFYITVDNQGASTGGNDFAIDDIRIYVKNPKIEVLQQSDDADICKNRENGAKLKLTMVYGQVKDALELPNYTDVTTDITRPLFWRLVHADTGLPVNTAYGDSTYNAGHTHDYGAIVVHSTDTLNRRNLYVDANEYYHLILADRFFKLDPHKQYYVSIATPRRRIVNGVEVYEPSSWGTPNATCSIYSEPQDYVQQDAVVTDENGSVSTIFSAECGATTVTVQMKGRLSLPDGVNGGRIEVSRWPFDWFSGSAAEFQAVSGLNTALVNFRAEYPDSHTLQPTKAATPRPTPHCCTNMCRACQATASMSMSKSSICWQATPSRRPSTCLPMATALSRLRSFHLPDNTPTRAPCRYNTSPFAAIRSKPRPHSPTTGLCSTWASPRSLSRRMGTHRALPASRPQPSGRPRDCWQIPACAHTQLCRRATPHQHQTAQPATCHVQCRHCPGTAHTERHQRPAQHGQHWQELWHCAKPHHTAHHTQPVVQSGTGQGCGHRTARGLRLHARNAILRCHTGPRLGQHLQGHYLHHAAGHTRVCDVDQPTGQQRQLEQRCQLATRQQGRTVQHHLQGLWH